MERPAFDVFISYSSQDKEIADALCRSLEQRKIRCWIAPRNILPGQNYAAIISQTIKRVSVFVLVFSEKALLSQWVNKEANIAVKYNKIIIPFRLENCPFEDTEMELYLNNCHWIDAFPRPDEALEKLCSSVCSLINIPEPPAPVVPERKIQQQPAPVVPERKIQQQTAKNALPLDDLLKVAISVVMAYRVDRKKRSAAQQANSYQRRRK